MSKRRRVSAPKDKYYQTWNFKLEQTVVSEDEEFTIPCPRPLEAPPSGRYYAIELHALEYYIPYHFKATQSASVDISISKSARQGRTPFITHCGDPENIFWYEQATYGEHVPPGVIPPTNEQADNHVQLTDNLGHGLLVVAENIFVQLSSNIRVETEVTAGFKLYYTFTTVSCSEYLEELASQIATS